MNNEEELSSMLSQSFDLELPALVSREQIIAALSFRIDKMMAGNPDQLFSLLYRLDISEAKIKSALATEHDVSKKIATLIYERQSEKIISRRHFKSNRPEDDLAW